MNKNDLRVKKTQKAITTTFLALLETKPVSKITVTELSKKTEINKATFYLHYKDIFDLYQKSLCEYLKEVASQITFMNLFFTDIEQFAEKLYDLSTNHNLFKKSAFFAKENTPYNQGAMQLFCSILSDKALSLGFIANNTRNKMKLNYIFAGIGILFRFDYVQHKEDAISIITGAYKGQFL